MDTSTRQTLLEEAAAHIQAGRIADGVRLCRKVLQAYPSQPTALHLLAMAAWAANNVEVADEQFRAALAADRAVQPGVSVDYARFLRSQARNAEAIERLREVTAAAPSYVPAWYQLAMLNAETGALEEAAGCAARVTRLAPRYAQGWELLASVEQKRKNLDAAIEACRQGLRQVPGAGRLHYSLGQLLREACCFVEAAEAYEVALRCGFDNPELHVNRGEALLEAGDSARALESMEAGVARFPDNARMHGVRARLHWESGAPGDPLAALRAALEQQPHNASLWQTLADLLNRLDRTEDARAALAEASARGCPPTLELRLLGAIVTARSGAIDAATEQFERLAADFPADAGIRHEFAEHLLVAGEPARAEQLCAEVLSGDPLDQVAWALRGTAWQLLGDPREAWLLDYASMVRVVEVPVPAEFTDRAAFFAALAQELDALHRSKAHPIDQTLRGGTQTNGFLFRLPNPLLRSLARQIEEAVSSETAAFPTDNGHPFWGRRPAQARGFGFAGAWSVRLRSQGYHTNHIHPQGWISSALYIQLPDVIRDSDASAGHIQFGVPPFRTVTDIAPRRVVRPEVGMLVLFPSYMWHGTVPFESGQPRLTVAFDVVPAP